MHGCGQMAQGSGFQLLIMTDLYPATALSFFTLFSGFILSVLLSLCLSLAVWQPLLARSSQLPICCSVFGCGKIHQIKSPGSHIVNLTSPFLPSVVVNGVPWSSEGPRRNSHTFNCRMLVNPHSESQDEPHEHEPQQQKYETMQCFAVSEPKSIKEEGDGMQGERGDSVGKAIWRIV